MDKQHILDEIKRAATANGGVPLGRDRFLKETGIRDSDWFGKYWVRWNEALIEAGFGPNSMLQAYEESTLLEKYAGLIREIGRIPRNGDLLMKARGDTAFPSEKTFRRLGSKAQRIARIIGFCRERDG